MSDVFGSLAAIRAQLAEMIGEVDMAELPPPDKVRPGSRNGDSVDREPGATWEPAHKVKVFTVDTKDGAGAVFITDATWGYTLPSDWEAFKPEDARRLGMALLAAAQWVDERRPEMPRIDADKVRPLRPAAS